MDYTQTKIKEFLARYFRNHELKEDEDIFALGFVNSLMAMQLVAVWKRSFKLRLTMKISSLITSEASTPSKNS